MEAMDNPASSTERDWLARMAMGQHHGAPADRRQPRQLQGTRLAQVARPGANKVHHGGGGQGIEGGAQVRHGGGQDGGDGQAGDSHRQALPDEQRIDAIQALGRLQAMVAVVDIQEQPDEQKERKLDGDHHPTGQQGGAALALVAGAQQALHHELIGAVAGGGEETTARQAGPEAILAREKLHGGGEAEIEDRQFVSRRRHGDDVAPSARNFPQDDEKADRGAGHVQGHLYHVGPDDRRHTAFEGVNRG
jgi:hypothetical protein